MILMNRRDRTLASISHKQPDRTPYTIEFTNEQLENTVQFYGMGREQFDEYLANHCLKVSYNGGHFIEPGIFQDEFGVEWDRTGIDKDIGIIRDLKFSSPRDTTYSFPEPDLQQVRDKTTIALKGRGDAVLFGKIGTTYFERAWSLCGLENMLLYMALEQQFAVDLLGSVLEYNLKIIDTALEYGIDGFYFGDDYGQQTGLLMSPEMWRKFIKPGLKEMFKRVKKSDKIVALHSCGDISAILPDLIEIGLDIYQTVQPEVYNLARLKSDFGDALCFWGGISTQRDLPFGSPEELRETISTTLDIMSRNGGYIAGPTHRLPTDIPLENVHVLIETLRGE